MDQFSLYNFHNADNHLPNATMNQTQSYYVIYPNVTDDTSDQRRWDSWARLTSPLLSQVPMVATLGNHEVEPQVLNNNASFYSKWQNYICAKFIIAEGEPCMLHDKLLATDLVQAPTRVTLSQLMAAFLGHFIQCIPKII